MDEGPSVADPSRSASLPPSVLEEARARMLEHGALPEEVRRRVVTLLRLQGRDHRASRALDASAFACDGDGVDFRTRWVAPLVLEAIALRLVRTRGPLGRAAGALLDDAAEDLREGAASWDVVHELVELDDALSSGTFRAGSEAGGGRGRRAAIEGVRFAIMTLDACLLDQDLLVGAFAFAAGVDDIATSLAASGVDQVAAVQTARATTNDVPPPAVRLRDSPSPVAVIETWRLDANGASGSREESP
jgi:hypothetical protein